MENNQEIAKLMTGLDSIRKDCSNSGIITRNDTRNLAVAGPVLWNSLPANIRSASVSLQTFCRRLKTCLFEVELP